MSPELKQFYKELQDWIDSGFPPHPYFSKGCGICGNLHSWDCERIISTETLFGLLEELHESFKLAGLNSHFPFNAHRDHFNEEAGKGLLYKNPTRLAWIKEHSQD